MTCFQEQPKKTRPKASIKAQYSALGAMVSSTHPALSCGFILKCLYRIPECVDIDGHLAVKSELGVPSVLLGCWDVGDPGRAVSQVTKRWR